MSRNIDGLITETDRDAMQLQRPVSALSKLRLSNNVQHLVDVGHQQRILWVASTADSEYGGTAESLPSAYYHYQCTFPATITDRDKMPSYAIGVATVYRGSPDGGRLEVSLNAWSFSNGAAIQLLGQVQVLDIVSGTAAWHDFTVEPEQSWARFATRNIGFFSDVGNGPYLESTPGSFVLVQLMVRTTANDPDNGGIAIIGLDVREYFA